MRQLSHSPRSHGNCIFIKKKLGSVLAEDVFKQMFHPGLGKISGTTFVKFFTEIIHRENKNLAYLIPVYL